MVDMRLSQVDFSKNSIIGWKRHLCHLSQTEHRTKDRLELGSGNLGCDEMVLGIDAPNKPRIAGAEGSEAPSGNLSFRRWVVSARFQSRAGPRDKAKSVDRRQTAIKAALSLIPLRGEGVRGKDSGLHC